MKAKHKKSEIDKYTDSFINYSNSFIEILATRLYPSITLWRNNRSPNFALEILDCLNRLDNIINKIVSLDVPSGYEIQGADIKAGFYEIKAGLAILRRGYKENNAEIINQGEIFTRMKFKAFKQQLLKYITKNKIQN